MLCLVVVINVGSYGPINNFEFTLTCESTVYNDAVSKKTKLFKEWLAIKNPLHKNHSAFTDSMAAELEEFYLERYCESLYNVWYMERFSALITFSRYVVLSGPFWSCKCSNSHD